MVAILNGSIAAFFASFLQYLLIALIMVGIAICGIFVGKKLRDNKDKKNALKAASEEGSLSSDKK